MLAKLVAVLVLAPPVVEPVAVTWDAPASCPDAATARARVVARLAAPASSPVVADLRVVAAEDAFVLHATITDDGGTKVRSLQAASCDELLDAAAVLVSMAVAEVAARPDLVPPVPPAPEPTIPEPSTSTAVAVPLATPRRRAPSPRAPSEQVPRRSAPTLGLRAAVLGGAAGLGLPSWTGAITGRLGLGGRRFEATAGLQHWLPRTTVLAPDARARFTATAAELRGCGVVGRRSLDVPLCGAVWLGAVVARGLDGLEDARRATDPWVALSASAGLRWWFSRRFGVLLETAALASTLPTRFDVGGLGRVCCRWFAVTATAGLGLRLDG